MTNREALEAIKRKERLDQTTIRRLVAASLIEVADVTTLDTPNGETELLPIQLTVKGQRLLDKKRSAPKKKTKSNKTFQWVKNAIGNFQVKASLTVVVPVVALYLTYKYAGADDLRTKVYAPLIADIPRIESCINANSTAQPCLKNDILGSLRKTGDFYRLPKSIQSEISALYGGAGALDGHVSAVAEVVQHQISAKIMSIKTEESDRTWIKEATDRIRSQPKQAGVSAYQSFSFTHAGRGKAMDVRDPNNPIISGPGGPTWEINDWVAFPDSVDKVGSLWTEDDFLYFDETRDLWYYRVSRPDLKQQNLTLRDFLQPTFDVLAVNADFKTIKNKQSDLLEQCDRLKKVLADRMDSPKQLKDLLD